MQHQRKNTQWRRDAGAVLITVMLVMLGLLGLGLTALWLTGGNLQIAANSNLRNQALYVAEMGIEEVRADLNGPTPRDMPDLLNGGDDPTHDDIPVNVADWLDSNGRPRHLGAIYKTAGGKVLSDPSGGIDFPPAGFNRGSGSGGSGSAPQSTTMGKYTVWIRNDTAELRQGAWNTDANNTVVIRSRGLGPDGKTTVVLEVTLGPGTAGGGAGGTSGGNPPVLCNSGKNACDDNNSVQNGIVVQ